MPRDQSLPAIPASATPATRARKLGTWPPRDSIEILYETSSFESEKPPARFRSAKLISRYTGGNPPSIRSQTFAGGDITSHNFASRAERLRIRRRLVWVRRGQPGGSLVFEDGRDRSQSAGGQAERAVSARTRGRRRADPVAHPLQCRDR